MYSSSEVAKVFQKISQLLNENPLMLSKEGVFRLSGKQTSAQEIIDNILRNKPIKKNSFSIHDYISALKLVLNESKLLNQDALSVQFLKDSLESSDPTLGAQILTDYFDAMIKSTDENEHNVGAIFYHYFQLATLTSAFEEKNKMSAENLGKILGPNIEKLINNDPKIVVLLILKLNDVCQNMLQSNFYADQFENKYAPYIIAMKEKQLDSLHEQKTNLKYLRTTYQEKIQEYRKKRAAEVQALTWEKNSRNRKLILEKINDYEKTIALYKKDDKEDTTPKLKAIKTQIALLAKEVQALKTKYPTIQRKASIDALSSLQAISSQFYDLNEWIEEEMQKGIRDPQKEALIFEIKKPKQEPEKSVRKSRNKLRF